MFSCAADPISEGHAKERIPASLVPVAAKLSLISMARYVVRAARTAISHNLSNVAGALNCRWDHHLAPLHRAHNQHYGEFRALRAAMFRDAAEGGKDAQELLRLMSAPLPVVCAEAM